MELKRYTADQFKKCLADGQKLDEALVIKGYAPEIVINKAPDAPAEQQRVVQFVISTGAVDRDGDTIDPAGWDLASFQSAGSILWGHDSRELPIAQSLGVWVEQGKLKARCKFPTRDVYELSDTVYQLILHDVIRATSVGFKPKSWTETNERSGTWGPALDFKTQELLEWSCVSVPANPEALVEAKSLGVDLAPYLKWVEQTLDTVSSSGLLVPRNALEKAYFASKSATSVVLPGVQKAGRVLSTKNLDRLTSAVEAIQEVIDSAGTVEDDEEEPAPAEEEGKSAAPVVEEDDDSFEIEADDEPDVKSMLNQIDLKSLIGSIVRESLAQARGQ